MKNDFLLAIAQLAAEKNLAKEVIFQAVEAALASAYRRDGEEGPEVHVRISGETGDISAFIQKTVVRNIEDENLEVDLEEAKRYKPDARIDDILEFEVKPPENAGRIAAQTAKQVVLQRLREAERGAIYEEYADKQGEVLLANVQRVESRQATVEIGRGTEALLPGSEMVRNEHLRAGQRVVLLLEVNDEVKGPQVIVSRGHRLLLRRLLEVEVPEIAQGRVEVNALALVVTVPLAKPNPSLHGRPSAQCRPPLSAPARRRAAASRHPGERGSSVRLRGRAPARPVATGGRDHGRLAASNRALPPTHRHAIVNSVNLPQANSRGQTRVGQASRSAGPIVRLPRGQGGSSRRPIGQGWGRTAPRWTEPSSPTGLLPRVNQHPKPRPARSADLQDVRACRHRRSDALFA